MSEAVPSLAVLQRRLQRLVTDPDGVEAALAAGGDADGAQLAALLSGGGEASASARLAVYANAYFVRIRDCLREDFGALAAVLGEAVFHDLVKTYLMRHPPSRPSLRHAGAQLGAHLRTQPFATIFSRHFAAAADLADLEWAIVEAFDAADAPAIGPDALAGVPPEDWDDLRFALTPSLRILHCDAPVHLVREHFDAHGAAPRSEDLRGGAGSTHICVWRHAERVFHRAMPPLESAALADAMTGESFGAICGSILEAVGDAEAPRVSAEFLRSWLTAGLVVAWH